MASGIKTYRMTMVPKEVKVFDLTDITDEEMLVISNAVYCFMNGSRPSTDHMRLINAGKTQAQVARDLYATICRVRESVAKEVE